MLTNISSEYKVNEITDAFVEFDIDNDGTITTKVILRMHLIIWLCFVLLMHIVIEDS